MAVKGYVKPVDEVVKKFTENVRDPDARKKYEDNYVNAMSSDWSTWYNNMMYNLLTNADSWVNLKGAAKVMAIANLNKEASAAYRKAKLVMFAKRAGREIAQAHSLIEEAARATITEYLGVTA